MIGDETCAYPAQVVGGAFMKSARLKLLLEPPGKTLIEKGAAEAGVWVGKFVSRAATV